MDSATFYELTWYEWSLCVHQIQFQRKKRLEDHDLIVNMFRSSLSFYHNWMGGTPKTLPQDFWRLSWEKEPDNTEATEEDKQALIEKIKHMESKSKWKKRG